ncbi:hypothetical protein QBC47DRAFT_293289 [Echria macrotheca]|uniref:NmrA-like domain-containing protein n=1 Tax=Echria macrotheca TaxID=438768 RepID=A0AAJ0BKH2_9PEZI|nr:hypothetical protein QBC47DRAFT_293289 [Echria macrotheca]
MSPSKQQRLLWVHSTEPTGVRRRDKATMNKIRRHIMEDIGISRRKPQQNPQFVIEIGSPLPPFWNQDPLSVLEQQWQMDTFAAYGLSLLAAEGKRLLCNADALTSEGFLFPFAFTSSAFLRHFRAVFSDPSVLKGIYHRSSAKIRVLALERSLGTISCIEATLANTSLDLATADRVIYAVLAAICYNLLSLEFDQARVHLEGLVGLIAARGETQSQKDNNELRLMIFWVDVAICLLFNTSPRYSLPLDLTPAMFHTDPSEGLPIPVSRILAAEADVGVHLTHIPACVAGLSEVAITIESELAARGNALWDDEIFLGLWINPLAHRLFDSAGRTTGFSAHLDQTLESIRLGVIVWIIWVKRMCRSWPGSPMAYVPELLGMLSGESSWAANTGSSASDDLLSVRLWLSVLCGIASCHGSSEREAAVSLIAEDMHRLNGKEWSEVMVRVRQMPWISSFETRLAEVKSQVLLLHVSYLVLNMSTSSSHPQVIVVLGATGHQGGGVVRALLKSKSWIVRAGTRKPGSSKAQKLLNEEGTEDGRLELVVADVYDIETLRKAFVGAYGVFAITSESHPHKEIVDEEEMQHEIEAGRNLVLAAKECNVQHFVFSSLPDMMQATSGQFSKLYHMNNKHTVEKIAREELPGRVTCLIPGFFYTNLQWPQYCRRRGMSSYASSDPFLS